MELQLEPLRRIRDDKGRFCKFHPNTNVIGAKRSKKVRRNISRANKKAFKEGRMKPPKYTGKKVVVIKDGVLISTFESAQALAEHFKVGRGVISRVCRGERKTYKGYQLFYEDNPVWINLLK